MALGLALGLTLAAPVWAAPDPSSESLPDAIGPEPPSPSVPLRRSAKHLHRRAAAGALLVEPAHPSPASAPASDATLSQGDAGPAAAAPSSSASGAALPAVGPEATQRAALGQSAPTVGSASLPCSPQVAPAPAPRPAAPPPPPEVRVGKPRYLGDGRVPLLLPMLNKARPAVGRCVAEHGGLAGKAGRARVEFLVRARGKAEGVGIEAAKGLSAAARRCVRQLIQNRWVGAPTTEPVGVAVDFTFKATRRPARPRPAPEPAALPPCPASPAAESTTLAAPGVAQPEEPSGRAAATADAGGQHGPAVTVPHRPSAKRRRARREDQLPK